MKFLVDQPVSPMLAAWLRSVEGGGHDAVHTRERGLSRAADAELFALAVSESRVIVKADVGFSRLIALSGLHGPRLVLFRAGNITDDQMLALLQRVIAEVGVDALSRVAVVIDEWSIRVSPLPIRFGAK